MSQEEDPLSTLNELPPQTELRGFSSGEMVKCDACLRANPPTRTNCLYCQAVLPSTEAVTPLRKPTLRRLESWEQGYNTVLTRRDPNDMPPPQLAEIAALLRLELEDTRRIFNKGEALPLARAATFEEASLVEERLRALGVETLIVPDADLAVEKVPPQRIRALELKDDVILARETATDSLLSIPWAEVSLMVSGRLFVTEVETEENKFRGGERDLIDSRELSSDDGVLHLYGREPDGGWRIVAGGFDFSCLGERKGLLASRNYDLLLAILRERAPLAEFDDSYVGIRHLLSAIWPMEQQTAARGWHRARPGKHNIKAVTRRDNESQFTRYSRLRHYLKLRGI
ncbi:MAG: hypothetical protein ABJC05_04010 [Pyrinomonadaceae bacterium]